MKMKKNMSFNGKYKKRTLLLIPMYLMLSCNNANGNKDDVAPGDQPCSGLECIEHGEKPVNPDCNEECPTVEKLFVSKVEKLPEHMTNESECSQMVELLANQTLNAETEIIKEKVEFDIRLKQNSNLLEEGRLKFVDSENFEYYLFGLFTENEASSAMLLSEKNFSRYCKAPKEYTVSSSLVLVSYPKFLTKWKNKAARTSQEIYDDEADRLFGINGLGYGSHYKAGIHLKVAENNEVDLNYNDFNFFWKLNSIEPDFKEIIPESILFKYHPIKLDNCQQIIISLSFEESFSERSILAFKDASQCGDKATPFLDKLFEVDELLSEEEISFVLDKVHPFFNRLWQPVMDDPGFACEIRDEISQGGCFYPIIESFQSYLFPYFNSNKDLYVNIHLLENVSVKVKLDKNSGLEVIDSKFVK